MGRPYYEPRVIPLEQAMPEHSASPHEHGGSACDQSATSGEHAASAADAPFHVISHDVLFGMQDETERCHACDVALVADDDAPAYDITGRGLLLFSRGDERRAEEPSLCPSCGAAIGMTMLTRWAIEEDEG